MRLILKSEEYYELNNVLWIKIADEEVYITFNTKKGRRYKETKFLKRMIENLDEVIDYFELDPVHLPGRCPNCESEFLFEVRHYRHYIPQHPLEKKWKERVDTPVMYKCNKCGEAHYPQDLNTTKTITYYV